MSYLNALRLHFAGQFQANVSTVNNDPAHFDNAIFEPGYQQMQGPGMVPPNGWFNPQGDAAWRFLGCGVTSAWMPSGAVTNNDPVLGYIVADSDAHAPAKLVDLDSEQQLVSEIWGLQVRIVAPPDADHPKGRTLLRGEFAPAAFADIWDRATGGGGGGDTGAGAMYQSVLTDLQWGDVSSSPFLSALQQAATDGLLSIKFNVDGFNLDNTSPDFMTGRIAGTIGPATADEPRHMVMGRQFMADALQWPAPPQAFNFFGPVGQINFCVGRIDRGTRSLFLDLGNALSTSSPGGPINDLGCLILTAVQVVNGNPVPVLLGLVPSQGPTGYAADPNWYATTAGVVELKLDDQTFEVAENWPLVITGGNPRLAFISEWSSGAFVRADRFVFRLSPNEQVQIAVYAMQWGRPLREVALSFDFDSNQLQGGSGFPYVAPSPPVATPTEALSFDTSLTTDANGRVLLTLNTTDPGTPRYFNNGTDYGIDGQVYGILPGFVDPQFQGPLNQWNFISILLWSGFTPSSPDGAVTWADLQPIFQQYANLYPVMNRFLNLADYDAVVANARLLLLAFGLDPTNPNSMPVTRDLSPAKRNAILAWLKDPVRGEAPAKPAPAAKAAPATEIPAATAPSKGGKAAAASRRFIFQKR